MRKSTTFSRRQIGSNCSPRPGRCCSSGHRGDDPQRIADAYISWWRGKEAKPLIARQHPDTLFRELTWEKGVIAPAYRGFVTLIMGAPQPALRGHGAHGLSLEQVLDLGEHVSRALDTLVVAAPHAAEEAPFAYAIYEAGQQVFAQSGRHIYEETVVKTDGEAWLGPKNIVLPTSGAAAWVFEDICEAIDLRAWEFRVDEKHTYYGVEEQ
jgi:hypothetical protein